MQQASTQTASQTASAPTPEKKKKAPRGPRGPLNGVNVPALFATIDAVAAQPVAAQFVFRAENRWLDGTFSKTTMGTFSGAGGDHEHTGHFAYEADHPTVLVGEDRGPTPIEFLLHALASCLTAGVANIASARGVTLAKVASRIEGDINMLGILGLDDSVRNGYERLRISFEIEGDASDEVLAEILQQSRRRSAVFDVLTNGCPVEIELSA